MHPQCTTGNMMTPTASYSHQQLQLKILNTSDRDARHADAETKIAVHLAMFHLQHTGDTLTGAKVTSLLKDIGIAYNRARHVYTVNVGPAIFKTITESLTAPINITTQSDVKYELLFAEIDYTAKTSKQSQKLTIYKAHVHLDPDIKEAKIGGEATEFARAKVERVVDDAARLCGLKVIRCAHACDLGRPIPTKLYVDFDTDLPRLDPYAPWKKLFEPQFPDTENFFKVKFQQTFDEVHGRKINPIEALGICMRCGKVNKSFDQGILCNCEGGSRKRKFKDDAGKLAALMGK